MATIYVHPSVTSDPAALQLLQAATNRTAVATRNKDRVVLLNKTNFKKPKVRQLHASPTSRPTPTPHPWGDDAA